VEGFWAELALELFLLVDDFVSFQLEDRVEALGANLAHVSLVVELALVNFLDVGDEIPFDEERLSAVVTRTNPMFRLLVGLQGARVLKGHVANLACDSHFDFMHGHHVSCEGVVVFDFHAADPALHGLLLGPLGHVEGQLVVGVLLLTRVLHLDHVGLDVTLEQQGGVEDLLVALRTLEPLHGVGDHDVMPP